MSANHVAVHLVPGEIAPRYDEGVEIELESVTITEQGTEARLPLVDLKLRGPNGERYLAVVTGRIMNMISAAVKGVNLRNHGIEEP